MSSSGKGDHALVAWNKPPAAWKGDGSSRLSDIVAPPPPPSTARAVTAAPAPAPAPTTPAAPAPTPTPRSNNNNETKEPLAKKKATNNNQRIQQPQVQILVKRENNNNNDNNNNTSENGQASPKKRADPPKVINNKDNGNNKNDSLNKQGKQKQQHQQPHQHSGKQKKRKPMLNTIQLGDLAPELYKQTAKKGGGGEKNNRQSKDDGTGDTAAAVEADIQNQNSSLLSGSLPGGTIWGRTSSTTTQQQERQQPPLQKLNTQPQKQPTTTNPEPTFGLDDFPTLGLAVPNNPSSALSLTKKTPPPRSVAATITAANNNTTPKLSGNKSTTTAAKQPSNQKKNRANQNKKNHDGSAVDTAKSPPPPKNNAKPNAAPATLVNSASKKTSISIADMFVAKPRTDDRGAGSGGGGDELQLMRLMQQGKVASAKKGRGFRQRIGPRKKRFSALKKRVLKERVQQWHQLQPNDKKKEDNTATAAVDLTQSFTVCILGFAEPELLEDQDEYEELCNNLKDMASQVAPHKYVYIPKELLNHAQEEVSLEFPAFVQFVDARAVDAAVSVWNGLAMGGQPLEVKRADISEPETLGAAESLTEINDTFLCAEWEKRCLEWWVKWRLSKSLSSKSSSSSSHGVARVILENVLTDDDLDDEDCLDESLLDIRAMAETFGVVADVQADLATRAVILTFQGGTEAAQRAVDSLSKTIVGGETVVARVDLQQQKDEKEKFFHILLNNALSEEDMEDEDCLKESLEDLRELASKYGNVISIELVEETSSAKILFSGGEKVAQLAAKGFQGMVIGGVAVEAVVLGSSGGVSETTDVDGPKTEKPDLIPEKDGSLSQPKQTLEVKPMFSGDKLIGELWAEMKRVPKVPNAAAPRKYATLYDDENVKPLLTEMLGELMRLQKRALEEGKNTTSAKKRLVMGLREVARGIRTKKVRMVVMANNLDEYGAIDEKMQEILDLAHQESVPVFFEFNKRGLGKAIGKSIKIAVVGIQNPDGAYEQFKKLLKIYLASAATMGAF